MRRANVFTISPGVPFLATFVDALQAGRIVSGLPDGDPLALAAATIYTPTRRAARALVGEFARRSPTAAVLPRIVPLGETEAIEADLLFDGDVDDGFEPIAAESAPAPAIDELERRLVFSRLIVAWGRSVAAALGPADDREGAVEEGFHVAARPGRAWFLARDLAKLVDEMEIEGAPWSVLDDIAPAEFDAYWSLTLDFLKIARDLWPLVLAERGCIEAAARRALLIEKAAERIATGRWDGPVIAIGSTGTNRATASLLAAIARSTAGAVVLPGLDMTMDEATWALVGGSDDAAGTAGHPQAALRRLLTALKISRDDVEELGVRPPAAAARSTFLSEALAPAQATERWHAFDRSLARSAFCDVDLIEAADERHEALALAVRLRELLETPRATAALVTPDRAIATRVRAELTRWRIEVDDSAGRPFADSPAGVFARLVLRAAGAPDLSVDFFALLAHPGCAPAMERGRVERLAALAELALARTSPPTTGQLTERFAQAREAAADRHAHPAVAAAKDEDFAGVEALVLALSRALEPLRTLAAGLTARVAPLAAWLEAHRQALQTLESPDCDGDDIRARDELFERLLRAARQDDAAFDAVDYTDVFESVARELALRGSSVSHPRIQILGLLEARLLSPDLVLLAGLDEGVWPPAASTDAFLNRPMRAALGLSAPERRIGQTAHDFAQAMGASKVVLSRAIKRAGAPTTPSRFLQRMRALAGAEIWNEALVRGSRWLSFADDVERAEPAPPIRAPQPRPALELRPVRLSVTRIETLRRDPYAIYAESILRLTPLPPLDKARTARSAGEELHAALADFVQAYPSGPLPDGAARELRAIAMARLSTLMADVEWRVFHWPRLETAIEDFVAWENDRRDAIDRIFVERHGALSLPLADGSRFTLTAIADRLEKRKDGAWSIVDYKSGRQPSMREVGCGFAPQLTLEAAMLERGAFDCAASGEIVAEAFYLGLAGGKATIRGTVKDKAGEDAFGELVAEHFDGMIALLSQFRIESTPYLSRPFPQFASRFGDFDHLARVKEWSSPADEEQAS
jgi:ATP-dependent helicase/nuclease subunit B